MGPDFALGHQGEGSIPALQKLGEELGFSVTAIPYVCKNGDTISSTAIRQAMAEGDMEKVRRMMDDPSACTGRSFTVTAGYRSGFSHCQSGCSQGQALPSDGVYVTLAHTDSNSYPQ